MIEPETSKPTILIVDDEAGPRNALQVILRPFFHLHAVDNAEAALRLIKEGRHRIDLVTLDLKLPDRSGVDLLQEIKLEHNELEVIIITGYGSLKSAMDGLRYGAAGYLLKPFNVTELVSLIKQTLAKKQRLDRVRHCLCASETAPEAEPDLAAAWRRLQPVYAGTCADFLSDVLESTDRELYQHSHRVSFYATRLGSHLRLSAGELATLRLGGLLHDLGMVASLPRRSGERFAEDREHPLAGASMILPFGLPAEVGQIIVYHHERFDGSGYPEGLQGDGIPLPARIVSVAQDFDQAVSGLPSPSPASLEDVLKHLQAQAGTGFDPQLVAVFAEAMRDSVTAASPFSPAMGSPVISKT